MRCVGQQRHERHAGQLLHGRQQRDPERRPRRARGGGGGEERAARPRRDQPRRREGEPHGRQGRRLGRRQVRHLRRAARRQALQRPQPPRRSALAGGAPGTKPVAEYKLVDASTASRASTSRRRSPASSPTRTTCACRGWSTAASSGRAARARTAPAPRRRSLSVDESSIAKIAGAKVVRYGDFVGVVADKEYAAIQAAAQLKVKWADMPAIAPVGNLFKQMREHDSAGKAPARIGASFGNFDTAYAAAPIKLSAELQVPLPGLDADRPVLCGRRRDAERRAHLHELAEHLPDAGEREDGARHGDGREDAAARTGSASPTTRARAPTARRRRGTTSRRRRRSCRRSSASRCGSS